MNIKHFITITNYAPKDHNNNITFAPTGNNGIATWLKLDQDFKWVDKVLELNTDVCLYTNEEVSLETAAHWVLAESKVMEKFIWKDTVAYSHNELISMASLNDQVSWQDIAFADRLILNEKYPSNYYFAKKINPFALAVDKNINKVLKSNRDNDIYIENINEDLNFFIIPLSTDIDLDEAIQIMNNLLIGGQDKIYKLEARVHDNNHVIGVKKIGEKLIHTIDISSSNNGNYIFGVIHLNQEDTSSLVEYAIEDLNDALSHINQVVDETLKS